MQRALALLALAACATLVWIGRNQLYVLGDIDLRAVILIVLINVGYYIATSERMLAVIRVTASRSLNSLEWFRYFILGRTLNELIPQGGHIYRGAVLKAELGIPIQNYAAAVVAYSWILNTQNLVVAMATLVIAAPSPLLDKRLAIPLVASLLAIVILAPFGVSWLAQQRRRPSRVARVAQEIISGLATFARDRVGISRSLVFGLAAFAASVATVGIVFSAVGVGVDIGTLILFVAVLQVGSTLSLTPGNIGIAELGYAGLAVLGGHDAALGVLAGAAVRTAGLVTLLALAIPTGAWRTARDFARSRGS